MAATSLKLPEELKRRIATLLAGSGRSPHAFMVEAIARETERAELRKRFVADALPSERAAMKSGKAFEAREVFAYFEARARGEKRAHPRAKAWRRSR
ncbi:MAG: CopG family ribbon-helix-helix protein [Myxococcota bacterium]